MQVPRDEKEWGQEVGQRIIAARRELGISQKELSELIHVAERSMQAYESGHTIPYRKLADLAAVLNKPAAWILHGEKASDPIGELAVLQDISSKLDRIVTAVETHSSQLSRA